MKIVFDAFRNQEFEYSPDEQSQLNEISNKISKLQDETDELKRQFAIKVGIIAKNLGDLKATDGSSFIESSIKPGKARATNMEMAFRCNGFMNANPNDGCGWVKGLPRQQDYDDLGITTGSSGIEKYCTICGELIERVELVHS